MKTIYIPGIPDVKMRPRSTKRGVVFDPNAEKKEASIQKARFQGDSEIYEGPLEIDYLFIFPRPKGHFGTGKNTGLLKSSSPRFCCNPKDLDNLEKFYADSFNSIAYRDDCQIVKSSAEKRWAEGQEVPCVRINITEIAESN